MHNLILGLTFSGLIGWAGYRKKALSKSGIAGAVVIGGTIFGLGGWVWGAILVAFFVSASGLSFFKSGKKAGLAEKFDKGHQRDFWQALANGGAGALIALVSIFWPGGPWWYAFLGAMATVNADTWATELGVLSRHNPRLITSGRIVPRGTSGGISVTGTLSALGGGLFVGAIAGLLSGFLPDSPITISPLIGVAVSGIAGLLGALLDSWLGATWQAIYYCDHCAKETEQQAHRSCGFTPTRRIRGLAWLNNDWVNFLSSAGGAVLAALLSLAIIHWGR